MNTAADDSVDFSSQGFALAHKSRSKNLRFIDKGLAVSNA